jgi:hypothetical protein
MSLPTAASTGFPAPSDVYDRFASLFAVARDRFGGELGGKLILLAPLDDAGAAISLAANISGAALLGVDHYGERLKWGVRHGVCDFLVNHLDEALRILKNEVRKQQPASVWLQADPAVSLHEIADRGVQPDIFAWAAAEESHSQSLAELVARGAVPLTGAPDLLPCQVTWTVASAASLWLPKMDSLAAKVLGSPLDERRRWLQYAPRYLGRAYQMQRFLRLTPDEAEQFTGLLRQEVQSGEVGVPVALRIENQGRIEQLELRRQS